MGTGKPEQAAGGADPREEPAVADGGDETRAHAVVERLLRARFMTAPIRRAPRDLSISSRVSGSARRQFGNSVVVPGTLGRSSPPSASSSWASTIPERARARARLAARATSMAADAY